MFADSKVNVYVLDDEIVVEKNQHVKKFPRCGITKVESFVFDMAKKGKLDDLLR